MARRWTREEYAIDAASLARALLGQVLVRVTEEGEVLRGRIIETEAYLGVQDRASHAFGGRRTARTEPMFGPGGTTYVYFTYGMHHCFNVVAGVPDVPAAVLVRALEPQTGLERMRSDRARAGRPAPTDRELCAGPARLCKALGLDRRHSGLDLTSDRALWVERGDEIGADSVMKGARIGIDSAGADWAGRPLRFWEKGSPFVSRPGA